MPTQTTQNQQTQEETMPTMDNTELEVQTQPQADLMDYETFRKLNESINAVVLNTASILEGYDKLDAKNITEHLEKIRSEALKIAGAPITQEKVQEIMTTIDTALNNALRRLEESGGVDVNAIKQELRADLERIKTELEASAQTIQAELQTSLDKANEQIQAVAGAKDAILLEVTEKLKDIVASVNGGSGLNYEEIVGNKEVQIELLHGASKNQPASTLCLVDWAEFIALDDRGNRRYLKIKGFGKDRTILHNKREGEVYVYDILANITEPISKVIPLNGNYILICQDNTYAYMLGLDWEMLGCFEDISNPMGAVKIHFNFPIIDAHCTGDTTYILLENGDVWASGRNPYTFGHNNNIDSNNTFTKTAFENIVSLNYVADRALDNRNGIALLDSAGNICYCGATILANQPTIAKLAGYERVWCLHNAVVANCISDQRTYAAGSVTGSQSSRENPNAWAVLHTSLKAQKVLMDSTKTMYLTNKQLFYVTGNGHNTQWIRVGRNTYGNGVNNTAVATPTKIFDGIEDMAVSNHRWILKKSDKSLWSFGLNAQKYSGVSSVSSTTPVAFKIFDGADDFVCGKNFTAVLKGKTISVCRELIAGNGFVEIYTAPTKLKTETTESTETTEQTTQTGGN